MLTYHPYAECSGLSLLGSFLFDHDLYYTIEDARKVINGWKALYPIDRSWIDVYDDDVLKQIIYISNIGGEWII